MSKILKDVILVGGGTGLSVMTNAVSQISNILLTSIVAVSDNGGSTGVLRDDFNIPAVGDIRRVVGAMSRTNNKINHLLEYRFDNKNKGLKGHSLGNLILAALIDMTGSLSNAVRWISHYMEVSGDVFAVSDDYLTLIYELEDGTLLEGEASIVTNKKRIKQIKYKEVAKANVAAVAAIQKSDVIILGIGSLYSSIMPNLAIPEVREAIKNSNAEVIYVANVMQEPGETIGYKLSDHINAIHHHIGAKVISKIIFNSGSISKNTLDNYKKQGQELVENDIKEKDMVLEWDLVEEVNGLVRHSYDKLKDAVEEVLK